MSTAHSDARSASLPADLPSEMRAFVLEENEDKSLRGTVRSFPTAALPSSAQSGAAQSGATQSEVTLRVAFSSINFKDSMIYKGDGRMVRSFPHIPGVDLSGTVIHDSSGRYSPGQEVLVSGYQLGVGHFGGYAEYARVPAEWIVPLPSNLDLFEVMAIGTAGLTAMLCLMALERNQNLPDGGPILVNGSSGGVGAMAIDLLAQAGYDVAASSGKPDMHPKLRAWGAKEILSREEVRDPSSRVLLKERWGGAIDNVGGKTLEYLLRTVRHSGSIALCGLVESANFAATVYPFVLRGVNLLGIDSVVLPYPRRQEAWNRLGQEHKPRFLNAMTQRIPLDELPAKLDAIHRGEARGRYVVAL